MKKSVIFLFFIFSFFSCQRKEYSKEELIKAFVNHSFYPIGVEEAREIVNKGIEKIKEKDKNFELLSLKGKRIKKADVKSDERIYYYPFILKKNKDIYLIIKVFDYSFAYDAGLKNSVLNSINEQQIANMDPCSINMYLMNNDTINIIFNDGKADWKMVVKKEINFFPFVWSAMINENTAYVNLVSLSKNSSTFFKNNLINLSKRGMKKIILDLRDLSVGNYEEAAKIISFFSKDESNYYIYSSKEGYSKKFSFIDGSFKNIKIAVLVDRKTALLGEIIAQSLKEFGAVIIGEKTAGMPYITQIFKVGNNSAAKLTVAKLYPPSGIDLDSGITPDFNVVYLYYKKYGLTYVVDCDPTILKAEEVLKTTNPI